MSEGKTAVSWIRYSDLIIRIHATSSLNDPAFNELKIAPGTPVESIESAVATSAYSPVFQQSASSVAGEGTNSLPGSNMKYADLCSLHLILSS